MTHDRMAAPMGSEVGSCLPMPQPQQLQRNWLENDFAARPGLPQPERRNGVTAIAMPRQATWTERGATFTIFIALGVTTGAWAAALPGLQTMVALSNRQLSLALLAVSIGAVAATLVAGVWAPRLGTGRATAGASLALAGIMTLPPLVANLWQFTAVAVLFGLAFGFTDVSLNGHASEVERRWGKAIMSSFHGAFSLGGLAGAALGGLLATQGFGPTGQMMIPAALVGCLVIGAAIGLGPGSSGERRKASAAGSVNSTWVLAFIALFGLMIEGAMVDWSAIYLATVVRVSEGAAAAGFAIFSVTMSIGRLTGDYAVRAIGARLTVIGGGAVAALGLALVVAFPAFVPVNLGFALVGLGLSNVTPTVFSAAGRLGPTPAAGMARVVSLGYVGFISGPPLIGGIASVFDLRVGLGILVIAAAGVAVSGFGMRTAAKRAA